MRVVLVASILAIFIPAFTTQDCSPAHCSTFEREVNALCAEYNIPNGKPLKLIVEGSTRCQCICSCVTEDTPILMADGKYRLAKHVRDGDMLYSPFAQNKVVVVAKLVPSAVENYPILRITLEKWSIITTDKHLFLGSSDRVMRADQLSLGDTLK